MDRLPGPLAERLLAPVVGYATRRAAQRQADRWNAAMRRPGSAASQPEDEQYDVEVGPRDRDGTWKLIWRPRPSAEDRYPPG